MISVDWPEKPKCVAVDVKVQPPTTEIQLEMYMPHLDDDLPLGKRELCKGEILRNRELTNLGFLSPVFFAGSTLQPDVFLFDKLLSFSFQRLLVFRASSVQAQLMPGLRQGLLRDLPRLPRDRVGRI